VVENAAQYAAENIIENVDADVGENAAEGFGENVIENAAWALQINEWKMKRLMKEVSWI